MRDILAKIGVRDVLVGVGLLLTASGAAMVYRPAGILTLGLALFMLGLYGVPRWR